MAMPTSRKSSTVLSSRVEQQAISPVSGCSIVNGCCGFRMSQGLACRYVSLRVVRCRSGPSWRSFNIFLLMRMGKFCEDVVGKCDGASGGNRTHALTITGRLLWPLTYAGLGKFLWFLIRIVLWPGTGIVRDETAGRFLLSWFDGWHAQQLAVAGGWPVAALHSSPKYRPCLGSGAGCLEGAWVHLWAGRFH